MIPLLAPQRYLFKRVGSNSTRNVPETPVGGVVRTARARLGHVSAGLPREGVGAGAAHAQAAHAAAARRALRHT